LLLQENDTYYRSISWTDATERIVQKIKTTSPDKTLLYASGRSSNEAVFLLKLFARQFGKNNVNIGGDIALFTGIAKALFNLAESNPSEFPVSGGKAYFKVCRNPAVRESRQSRLILMPVRSEGQFNNMV
jgi:anaerobic selenocysteine-containing dehydrogenase